jgi:hypothetical protein
MPKFQFRISSAEEGRERDEIVNRRLFLRRGEKKIIPAIPVALV